MRRSVLYGSRGLGFACLALIVAAGATLPAQQQIVPGNNVNMVSGTKFPEGDPYLQRQNEPSSAVSTRNPLHILGGANDYRTVDIPHPSDELRTQRMNSDAWVSLFKSLDGGQNWGSTLVPGYPQDPARTAPLWGYHAATDPFIRAGTNGMFYYAGLAFNRGENAPSAIFVARYMDMNNLEAGDPIVHLNTKIVDSDTGTRFLDKTALATDIARTGATCSFDVPLGDAASTVVPQTIPAGNVYLAYSAFTGSGATEQSVILFTRSTDCGITWSAPKALSTGSRLVQNAQIAVDPATGYVYVSWRRFRYLSQDDAVMVVRSTNGGVSFGKPVRVSGVVPFDQPTKETSFRSNGFQTMAVDATGRVYLAWTQRGHALLRPSPVDGDARIVVSTSTNGTAWTLPRAIQTGGLGHQLMPALTFHGGKLRLLYYDLREDISQVFAPFVDEFNVLQANSPVRHTMDVFVAQAEPGVTPVFTTARLSDYAFGFMPDSDVPLRLQFNPPNLPLFRLGTTPFMGDYIDLAPAPAYVQNPDGSWVHNTAPSTSVTSHAVWTDNRDVRPPPDGDWINYSPPRSAALGTTSRFDPSLPVLPCRADHEGMRNQNIYTARVTEGLFVSAPGNNKPLGTLQRAFVVVAENATGLVRSFRLTIDNQPVGGEASFLQFSPLPTLDVSVPPFSSVARTVFASSSDERARVNVSIVEITAPGGTPVPGGLAGAVVLNADPSLEVPRLQNPRLQNPRLQNPLISVAEAYNAGITNAVFAVPRLQNPRLQNPTIENPRLQNDSLGNPRLQNDAIANPGVVSVSTTSADIENPRLQNPRLQNPRLQNQALDDAQFIDTSWALTNDGNTTAAYTINLVLNEPIPTGFASQLLIHKTTTTPASVECNLAEQLHTVLVANIPDPEFVPFSDVANPRLQNPRLQNPTLALAPGESATITLRIVDPDRFDEVTYDATGAVTPAAAAQSVNTEDVVAGITTPTVAVPLTITTTALPPAAPGSPYLRSLQTLASLGPLTCSVVGGTLPPGVNLSSDGTLSGTPTVPGNYRFTVRCVDANGNEDDQQLFIQIEPPVPAGFDAAWNGADTDWADPDNWSPRGVPQATDRVYIPASITVVPTLTRNETIRDLVVEPGATVNTNGFTLTITHNADAGRTIIGTGTTVLTGDGGVATGVFSNLEIRGRITLSGSVTVTDRLTLTAGARLNLNGQSLIVGGQLTTNVTTGAAPVVTGPAASFIVAGVLVNGLVLENAPLTIDSSTGGALTQFDNVRFGTFTPVAVQLTISHPGLAASFAMNGISFVTTPTTGRLIQANDTNDGANTLIIDIVRAVPADGSAATATAGGAVVNWISDPDDANLAVTQSVSPIPVAAGTPLTYEITVVNGGPAAATGVTLNPGVPAGATNVTASTTQGACVLGSGGLSCDLGSIPAGSQVVVTVSFIPSGTGTLVTTASVTATGQDSSTGNNTHTIGATVVAAGAGVSLTLAKTGSAPSVALNTPFSYGLTVTNAGVTTANGVIVVDPVPAGVSLSNVVASQGTCSIAAGQVVCVVGTLTPGQVATITLSATASAAGLITNAASVTANELELTPADNFAVVQTMVLATAGCSVPTFTGPVSYPGSPGPTAVVRLVDMNHDGHLDAVATHEIDGGGVDVFLNDGTGQFAPPRFTSTVTGPWIHVVADFNGDTYPDVITSTDRTALGAPITLRLLTNDGTGTLTLVPTFSIPFGGSFVAEDVDRDGDTDLVIASGTSDDLLLLRNDGQANFAAPVTLLAGSSGFATFGDFNGDDRTDVIAVLGADGYAVLLADTSGGFLPPVVHSVPGGAFTVSVANLNGDGDLDLLIGQGEDDDSLTGQAFVALGDGAGGFGAPAAAASSAFFFPQLVDVTGEGHADIVGISSLSSFGVWPGNGLGGFSAPAHFANATYYWPTTGDVNGDGRVDIVTGDRYGQLNVFLNNCGAAPANLSVAVSESADPVNEGDELTYTVTVTNQTANVATGLRLTSVLTAQGDDEPEDPNVTVLAITSSDGGTLTTTGSTYTWTLPAQGPNARAIFTFRFRPLGGATLFFTSGVTSDGTETDPSDNAATETSTVTAVSRQIVVTNTNDSGPGSLRQAIVESNDPGDVDTIVFNIQPAGPKTIIPLSALPEITQPAIIDGTTQPGFSGTPIIELNGNGLAGNGLFITGQNTIVRGLVINRFGQNGILIFGGGNAIEGNYIGIDLTGSAARPNRIGVAILGSGNRVGGTTSAARNIISGNQLSGISIENATTTGNFVQGNFIGTNAAGTAALANGGGVFIGPGSTANTIGGTAAGAGNVISGNTGDGVSINSGSTGNRVQGNRIGTNASVTAPVPNTSAGVRVTAGTNTIGGTVPEARNIISGNGQSGVVLGANSVESVVQGNYIGTNLSGTGSIPNNQNGVVLNSALGVTIGGTQAGAGNVISGNLLNGINVSISAGSFIQGNHIGTNPAGAGAVANGSHGISINGSDGITIGGTEAGARNVISGNSGEGITIGGSGEVVTIQGNLIGTNAAGTAAIANRRGIFSTIEDTRIGGTSAAARNVISGNAIEGIVLSGIGVDGSTVEGNFIGTDITGTAAIPNLSHGIRLSNTVLTRVGGTLAGAGNLISGNGGNGVSVTGATTLTTSIQGNLIGLNAAGTGALGNLNGISVAEAAGTTIGGVALGAGNVVSGNGTGIQLLPGSSNTLVQGNRIGTAAGGAAAVPNGAGINVNASHGNTIGGAVANAGNVVSGNTGNGIWINAANSNVVQGNRIGTNADGIAAVPNGFGMFVMGASNLIGGTADGAGNLISGNTNIGISVADGAISTLLQGNRIGTNAPGTSALANGSHGVFLDGAGTTVGGTESGAANTVANNGRAGIRVNSGTGHAIRGNSVFANVDLGIDIGPGGVTANDVDDLDAGANNLQNFPVLTSAVPSGSAILVQGTLDSTPNTTFTVEIFRADADPTGFGEGAQLLAAFPVTTSETGAATFTTEVPSAGVTTLTATATDPTGNTSEFSANLAVTLGPQTFIVNSTNDSGGGSLRQAILNANANAGTLDTIAFGILASGVQTIALASPLPTITDPVVIDGWTQSGTGVGPPQIELDGTAAGPDANGFVVTAGGTTIRGFIINRFGTGGAAGSGGGTGIVLLDGGGNVVEGNYIGTDRTGTTALPNRNDGIWTNSGNNLIGGTTTGVGGTIHRSRNILSGNGSHGLILNGAAAVSNRVEGNYVGIAANGNDGLGNGQSGIGVYGALQTTIGGTTPLARNIVGANVADGISINLGAANTTVLGNYLGVGLTGTTDVGNGAHGILIYDSDNNTIGGLTSGAGNLISSNLFGLSVHLGDGNVIAGNLIGVDSQGVSSTGNDTHAVNVNTNATNTLITGNVLSGNFGNGVVLNGGSTGTRLESNFIGAGRNGGSIPNRFNGVLISDSSGNTIGGSLPGQANLIAYNISGAVIVVGETSVNNAILGNLIHSNVGLGIDLGGDGITPNDPADVDDSPNHSQNHPDLTAVPGGVSLALNSSPNSTYRIELFANTVCDPGSKGQARTFLGAFSLATDGAGDAALPFMAAPAGEFATATATDSAGNTSEFSQCVAPGAPAADLSISKTDSTDPVVLNTPFTYTLTIQNAGPGAATGVTVSDALPAGMIASQATSTRGSCGIEGESVSCLVGPLAAAESVTITLTVSAGTAGLNTNQAVVTADQNDPNPLNNLATETTMVLAGAACAAPTFSGPTLYPAGLTSIQLAAGDVNNDGTTDLIASNGASSTVNLLLSNGGGAFLAPTPVTVATDANSGASRVTVVDVNHDNNLDLVVTNSVPKTITVALGNGAGGFTHTFTSAPLTNQPGRVETADFNEDGHLDLLVPHAPNAVMLLGNGTGGFGSPTATAIQDNPAGGLSIGHFTPDAHLDVLIGASGSSNILIYTGDGLGGFSNVVQIPTTAVTRVAAAGDINGDGRTDVLLQDLFQSGHVTAMFGNPTGLLVNQTEVGNGISVFQLADVTGDSRLDIIATQTATDDPLQILVGSGTGSFSAPVTVAAGPPPRAVGDFNGDGRIDVAGRIGGSAGNTIAVFLNACGQPETDLSTDLAEAADPVQEGAPVVYTATITNHGSIAASDVRLVSLFDQGGVSATVTSSEPSCSMVAAERFVCALGALAAGATRVIEFTATAAAAGTLNAAASVAAAQADPEPANNADSETTVVSAAGQDIVVTNTNDSGAGSLRQAILDANSDAGDDDRIVFDIPGPGPHTITLTSPLPVLTQRVTIDGTTQPGFAGTPVIELNGAGVPAGQPGFSITAGNSTVQALAITRFSGDGISISGPGGNSLLGNYIGVGPAGTADLGNSGNGVFVSGSPDNLIGAVNLGNVISGNTVDGVRIGGLAASGNTVTGNRIGTNAAGTASIPNNNGVFLLNAPNNSVGGSAAGAGNLISGNGGFGVWAQAGSHNTTIQGNTIGLNADGTADLGNAFDGVLVLNSNNAAIGGTTAGARNVIAGNNTSGVRLSGSSTGISIRGNYIGTNAAAGAAVGNSEYGIRVEQTAHGNTIGGTAAGAGNVISGNVNAAVLLVGVNNTLVQGNRIGTDDLATTGIGNGGGGVIVQQGSLNTIGGAGSEARNVISGNSSNGVFLSTFGGAMSGNVVQNNFIGTNGSGMSAIPNLGHGIRIDNATDTQVGPGNVISGNNAEGIQIFGPVGTATRIIGNLIGTNALATSIVPNNANGILLIASNVIVGGTAAGEANFIGGNGQHGISIGNGASGNVVRGNRIGFNEPPNDLGNALDGIRIVLGSNNIIGGAGPQDGNAIGLNNGNGVSVQSGSGNQILGNRIAGNSGLGVDLGVNGVTANDGGDPDAGPNNLQNFPLLSAAPGGVTGTLNSTPNATFRVEFFVNAACDPSGNGEGESILGAVDVTADANGNASIPLFAADAGLIVTATATNATGDTSEFSPCVAVEGVGPAAFNVTTTNDSGPGSLRQAILDANASIGTLDTITFNMGNGLATIAPTSPLPAITDPIVIDGTTQPGFNDAPLIEVTGSQNTTPGANGLDLVAGNSTVRGLIINRWDAVGIRAAGPSNIIEGNYVGIDATGSQARPNTFIGVSVESGGNRVGGTTPEQRNVISGNGGFGVRVTGPNNVVTGNYIGTDVTGNTSIRNEFTGVIVQNAGNIIGGAGAAGNLISGNGQYGVLVAGPNVVQNNGIGTNAARAGPIGNYTGGVSISGDGVTLEGNTIAFNDGNGVSVDSGTGNRLLGNQIFENAGTGIDLDDGSGATNSFIDFEDLADSIPVHTPFPEDFNGVTWTNWLHRAPVVTDYELHGVNAVYAAVDGARMTFSPRVFTGARFTRLAANPGDIYFELYLSGALVWSSTPLAGVPPALTFLPSGYGGLVDEVRVRSLGASMTALGSAWAMDDVVFGNGVTPNDSGDADAGANHLQNFPVVTAVSNTSSTRIQGTLNSAANTAYTLHFYGSPSCDASGHGEAATIIGSTIVTTDGTGNAPFDVTFDPTLPTGEVVSATSTDPAGNTSELSLCTEVADPASLLVNGAMHTGAVSAAGETDVWTFAAAAGDRIAVHIGEILDDNDFRPWLRLASPTGVALGETSGVEGAVIDDVVAPVTGTYVVRVASFDPVFDGTGTYRLTMTHTPGPIVVSLGDEGGPVTNGGNHTGEIVRGDVDVWTFTATAGERIAVHIGELTETIDFRPWMRLWSPTGGSLGDTSGIAADVIDDVVAPVTGTYLLLVASFDPAFNGTGTYQLTMTQAPGPITVPPGDQGGPLTNGATHTGEIVRGDVDAWTFTATAGERIALHIGELTETDDFRPWMRLWTPTGASLGETSGVAASVIDDVVAPVTGTYLLLVGSFDPGFDGAGTYRLTMTHTPGPITVSPGDDGGPLANGATHAGEIVRGDVDVWTFTATAGERIALHVGELTETADFRPWMRLWSPNGASLGDTSGVIAAVIDDVVAPVTGTYLVLVGSFDPAFDGTGTYALTLTHTPGPIAVSPGDEGGPLSSGATQTGAITPGDLDVWTFTATAGEPIALQLRETGEIADYRPWMRLWSPAGASLGDTSGLTGADISVAAAPVAGTYLVLVASFDPGFDGAGSYSLALNGGSAAVTRTWIRDADGLWEDPANWSGGVAPQPGEAVVIDRPGNVVVTIASAVGPLASIRSEERLVLNGSLTFDGLAELNAGVDHNAGFLGGAGDLFLGGISTWTGGFSQGPGTTFIKPGAQLSVVTPGQSGILHRSITNDGMLIWNQTSLSLVDGARISNRAGGRFEIPGTFTIANGSGGTLPLVNAGTLATTGAAGTVTLSGGVELTTTGTLELRLGNESDAIVSDGAGTIGGTLDVRLQAGFLPAVGQQFDVLQFSSRTGTFAAVNGNGQLYTASYSPTGVTIAAGGAPSVFTVGNTTDSGPGSLRQAILDANAAAGTLDVIEFAIPGTGSHTIAPASPLPAITDPLIIDGTSQPGFSGMPLIELDGTNAGPDANGLEVTSGSSAFLGLVINRFGTGGSGAGGAGIALLGSGGNVIQGNFIGTDVAGTVALGNRTDGIVLGSGGNGIGGSNPGARNVISGNGRHGIFVAAGSVNSEIADNFIGVDRTGTADLGNGSHGIALNQGQAFIGTHFGFGAPAGAANVISGNGGAGISIEGDSHLHLVGLGARLGGNRIGTDAQGSNPIPNALEGVAITDSSNNFIGGQSGAGNVIAFNTSHGVHVVSGINNYVAFNSVFSNGGLGISLGEDGGTPNDPGDGDAGANRLQNAPTLVAAAGGVGGSFNGEANTIFQLHYYTNASCDPSGSGEGQTYVATDSFTTDANGDAALPLLAALAGSIVTATVSDPAGNTSEFSACVTAEATVLPTVTLTVINPDTSETTAGPTTFRFTRTGPTTQLLDVQYSVSGNNIGGDDYTPALPSIVTIPAGASSFDLTLTPVDDSEAEPPQVLILTVVPWINPTYQVGSPASGTMTIADDDGAAVVANDATGAELGGDTLTFTISRPAGESTALDRRVVVEVGGTAVNDYSTTAPVPLVSINGFQYELTIPAGQSGVALTLTPTFQPEVEGTETVIITAEGTSAQGEIFDEPPVAVAVTDATASELAAPGVENTITFVVSRTPGASAAYDRPVILEVSGSAVNDYSTIGSVPVVPLNGFQSTLTIPAGHSAVTLTLTPTFQAEVEGTETVIATVEGTSAQAEIFDEPPVTIAVTDATASEAAAPGVENTITFVVSRTAGASAAYDRLVVVELGGTAVNDYSATRPLPLVPLNGFQSLLTIPAGQSAVALTFTAANDGVAEGPETVILTAEGSSVTATILDESTTTTRTWVCGADGNWSDPANWSDGIIPLPDENAMIDCPAGNFVVTVDGDFAVVNLRSEERILLQGGSLTFGGNTQLNGGLTLSGGFIGGAGDLALGGNSVWTGGVMTGPGMTLISPGAELRVDTPGQDGVLHRSITNDGRLVWNQAAVALSSGARISNSAGGQFEIQGNLTITNSSEARMPLTNAGTLTKTGAGGAITLSSGIELLTTGTIELRLADGVDSDAIVSDAPGTLGGTLNVLRQGGFVPTVGQQFNLLQFSARTGTFAAINGNGVAYDALYASTGLTLQAASGNAAPIANAGPDQVVPRNSLVQLNGSGSADPEGGALTYQWTLITRPAGSTAALSDSNIANPTLTADRPGTYVAQLVVNDVLSSSGIDSVQITTANQAPVADAGPEQTGITPSSVVTLNGAASSDPDGDPITYSWTFVFRPVGSAATLTGASTASPTFLADLPGGYRLRLIVSDSFANSEDTVDVFTHLPPAGEQVSGPVTGLSYYNPAAVPNPDGQRTAGATSLSYYNPAPVPGPSGAVAAGSASVSYYNPAQVPSPEGAFAAASSNVSYYNPAPVPDPNGFVAAGVASVSYFNPAQSPSLEQQTAPRQMKPTRDRGRIVASRGTTLPIAATLDPR